MRMVKFLVCAGIFIAACVWCFNYTEGHESTLRKQTIEEYKGELNKASAELMNRTEVRDQLQNKLQQACDLLKAADVKNDLCSEEEAEETENSNE